MSKIYVATSFKNIPEARQVMRLVEEAGHEISHDWTWESVDESWDEETKREYLVKCGDRDYLGVTTADIVVFLNHELAHDAMAELGIALAKGKHVIILYPERRSSVFFHLAQDYIQSLDGLTHRLTKRLPYELHKTRQG